jgi:hypothetical protein
LSKKDLPDTALLQGMRLPIILALAALLFCSPGALCQTNSTLSGGLNSSDLQELLVNSSAGLRSYSFLMEMEQSTDLINLSSGESQELYTRSFGAGSVNMTARSLKLVLSSITLPDGEPVNVTATAIEEYLQNDSIYLKADGNWTVMKYPGVAQAWSQQTTMKQQIDMINHSRLSALGTEMVDGQECYVLRADIDMVSFADQLSKQVSAYLPVQSMNYSQLFSNMTLQAYYWIAKDTHLLKRSDVVENFVVSPTALGLPAKGPERQEMRVNSTISLLYQGFDQEVEIRLPEDAGRARPISTLMTDFAQPVEPAPPQSALNETRGNATLKGMAGPVSGA